MTPNLPSGHVGGKALIPVPGPFRPFRLTQSLDHIILNL